MTKEQKGMKAMTEIVNALAKSIGKSKKKYIKEMVSAMVVQADIIKRARKDGVEMSEIMPEIKKAYEKNTVHHRLQDAN